VDVHQIEGVRWQLGRLLRECDDCLAPSRRWDHRRTCLQERMVWAVKHTRFYRKQGPNGLSGTVPTSIGARNVLHPDPVKSFLSHPPISRENHPAKAQRSGIDMSRLNSSMVESL